MRTDVAGNRFSARAFFAGVLGGVVATGLIGAIVGASGGFDASRTIVVVQETHRGVTVVRGLTAHQVYVQDARGVVFVNAAGVSAPQSTGELLKGEGGAQGTSTGAGFEVGDGGTILTNWHVVANASKVTVGLDPNETLKARVIGEIPSEDLAVLRIPIGGLTLHPLSLGNSEGVQVGDSVLAIGNPFGLERTLTTGVVSALQRQIVAPDGVTISNALQTDAPINPGNSGGPLLNQDGQVIGINSEIETSGNGGSVGIAFAIPIDSAKRELKHAALHG